jgi:hypothetical protein
MTCGHLDFSNDRQLEDREGRRRRGPRGKSDDVEAQFLVN